MYTGERVTLNCRVGGDPAGWEYLWYKDTQGAALPNTDSSRTDGSSYTISSAAPTHSGEYWCRAVRGTQTFHSHYSDTFNLNISEVYTGERVTLSCGFGGDPAGWEYLWYKDKQGAALPNTDSSRTDGSSYTISSAALSHSGEYWCRAARGTQTFHSHYSDTLNLNISVLAAVFYFAKLTEGRPRASLTVDPRVSEVFIGEPITLCCAIRGSEENSSWKYTWKKQENQEVLLLVNGEDTSAFTLNNTEEADSIYYWCEANNGNTMIQSNHHKLKVTARPEAVLVLESKWTTVFPTERVTLRCDIKSSITGWSYEWLKDDQLLNKTGNSNRYTFTASAQSESGQYTCNGHLTTRAVTSNISSPITLWVKGEKPKPVITQDPPGAEVYTGERVTLSCGFGGDPAGWEYLWYKDTQGAALPNTDSSRTDGSSYTISSAALSHSGEYWCRAARGRGSFYSEFSYSRTLNISAPPQAELTVQSGWTEVFPTERVTLRCEIQGSSTEWMYRWYRDGQELPVDKADSSSGNGDTYTILSADQSHTGLYSCRGELTERGVQSTICSAVKLSVSTPPQAELTVQSGWTEVFPTERVTLRCEIQGSSTEWMYRWYRDGQELPVDKADSSSGNGDTYTILSADQ
ncbi:hypothetical protein JZ751_003696, partial [Albula glossodonta]